ncbi:hypothetical protein D3C72_1926470 [compost metagenome]
MTVIIGERKQRIDEEAGIFRTRLDALIGDFAVDLESFEVVLGDAVAIGIHIGQRPARAGMTLFSRVAIGLDGFTLVTVLVGFEAELEQVEGAGFLGHARIDVKSRSRHCERRKQHAHEERL